MDSSFQTTVKQFGKQEIIVLRLDIQDCLDKIKTKYGLSELTLGTLNYTASSFTVKINGKAQNIETKEFEQNEAKYFASRFELPDNLIGCEFIIDGAIFAIIRIETKNPKYPIIAKSEADGRTFKFTVSRTKELLDKHRVINITYKDEDPD